MAAREALEYYQPCPVSRISFLELQYQTPNWRVRAPLEPIPLTDHDALLRALKKLALSDIAPWIAGDDEW